VSVLLVDIGNSRIKWARWSEGRLGRQQARDYAGWTRREFERALFGTRASPERIVIASVASARVNRLLAAAAHRRSRVPFEFAQSARRGGALTTRYTEPWRLGVDRFLAAIGAHRLVGRRAACVIDVGTAMTIDLVDANGVHRGGAILPGPTLMVRSLLSSTDGIERRTRGAASRRGLFARNTRAAVQQGALYAAAAVADRAIAEARRALGSRPRVLLTGGDAARLAPLMRSAYVHVPDLVLRGLAVLAGLEPA